MELLKKPAPVFLISLILIIAGCYMKQFNEFDLEARPVKPELFGKGIISTSMYERDIAISPKGDEIVFTLSDYRQTRRCLVIIKKAGKKWGKKEILSFSGEYADIEPCFSVDGNQLFFASNRPSGSNSARSDYNIWVSERTAEGWSEPQLLPSNINTEKDEFYPSVSRNGNLYFTAQRPDGIGGEDIFMCRYSNGKYLDPVPLDTAINSRRDEFNACISPDEDLIIFGSYGRGDGSGGVDLYFSRKDSDGSWKPAANMGPLINSEKLDFCPFIDVPRGNFYFTSDRMPASDKKMENVKQLKSLANDVLNGMGNIYRIGIENLDLN